MRFLGLSLIVFLVARSSFAQEILTSPGKGKVKSSVTPSPGGPSVRPILLGSGPDSLVNKIDVASLMKKGQKDAAVMFSVSVMKTGEIAWSGTYRGTPGSKDLELELQKHLAPASSMRFVPAIYNGHTVDAIYYGTAMFAVVDGKPRLRIFSNQEASELEKESDFIGPQPFFGEESGFQGLHYPSQREAPVQVTGVAELSLDIDATGKLIKASLKGEEPPFLGFGASALRDFEKATFVPAFRDGKPVACQVRLPVFYKPEILTGAQ